MGMGAGLGTSVLRAWAEQGGRKLTQTGKPIGSQDMRPAGLAQDTVCAPLLAPAPPPSLEPSLDPSHPGAPPGIYPSSSQVAGAG